ncbi:hypothetical protein BJ973_003845 [Actinoplanes tereljensis]|uniref:PknH-like extracellular domain-containing protein n=1 Tax=Paractinoplanes tereljensis TaxID=571912 RepID=A0A919TZ62_9ACTN|nr:hypothetical protein [Actinoplanes tereljensis]GIF25567.1 hypothetical protein Ate02nite_82970 [Actinoplanes tereljensis]
MVNARHAANWLVGGVAALIVGGCSGSEPTNQAAAPTSPSAAALPSSTSAAGASPTAKAIPDSIPAIAFLQVVDAPGQAKEKPNRLGAGDQPLPAFCKNSYEQKDQVGVRATQLLLFASEDAPEGSTPKAAVYEDVIVFKNDGATKFMTSLRKAVEGCPTEKADSGVTLKNSLRGPVEGAGEDSVLIERTRPATDDAGEPVEGQVHSLFWAAIRQGDTIAFLSNTGWESGSAEKTDTQTLATRAASRIKAWRT